MLVSALAASGISISYSEKTRIDLEKTLILQHFQSIHPLAINYKNLVQKSPN